MSYHVRYAQQTPKHIGLGHGGGDQSILAVKLVVAGGGGGAAAAAGWWVVGGGWMGGWVGGWVGGGGKRNSSSTNKSAANVVAHDHQLPSCLSNTYVILAAMAMADQQ